MYEIPKPELLNPDRENRNDRDDLTAEDHRSQAQLLAKALGDSCAYADQLWDQVNALRGYLLDCLPPDPRTPGLHTTAGASPTGPDDEAGWTSWINAFATTSSVLCGAHGDSGFGLSRAREEARLRRTAPELLVHAQHPDLGKPSAAPDAASTVPVPADNPTIVRSVGRAVAAGAVAVLALRGLGTVVPRQRRNSGERT